MNNENKTLSYKGYIGSVEYDENDNIYWGKLLNTEDLILYHGNDLKELEKSFIESIDDYINIIEEIKRDAKYEVNLDDIDAKFNNKENTTIYVHYGHKEFDKDNFNKIQNRRNFNKPYGGLWASAVDAEYGWKEWNESSDYVNISEENSFKFKLSADANILVISSVDDVEKLPLQESDDPIFKLIASMRGGIKPVDFETLKSEGYDAIDFRVSKNHELYNALYGWDCDSILVMNPDIIEPILEKEKDIKNSKEDIEI